MYLCTQNEVHGTSTSDLTKIITYPHTRMIKNTPFCLQDEMKELQQKVTNKIDMGNA